MAVVKRSDAGMIARDAIRLDLGDLVREGQRLRAQAKAEAARILADARAERERIMDGAHEAGFVRGEEAGRSAGLEAGRAEGREAAQAEHGAALATIEASWASALDSFEREREAILSEARQGVVGLALTLAERVVKRAIELDPEVAAAQVEAAVELASSPGSCTIAVRPQDAAFAREALAGLASRLESGKHARIVEDDTLSPGSCVLRRGDGTEIDGRIETQLERLIEAVRPGGASAVRTLVDRSGGRRTPEPGPDAPGGAEDARDA